VLSDAVSEPATEPIPVSVLAPAVPTSLPTVAAPVTPGRLVLSTNGVDPVDLAVEFTRVVPPSGNVMVCRTQQFGLGPDRAGTTVTFWADTTVVHLIVNGVRLKTVPSRLTEAHLQRLLDEGGRPAGPPPIATGQHGDAIEVDRTVNGCGQIGLAGRQHPIGFHFAGRRLTVRLDHGVLQLIDNGVLLRTLPNPLAPRRNGPHPGRSPRRTPTDAGSRTVAGGTADQRTWRSSRCWATNPGRLRWPRTSGACSPAGRRSGPAWPGRPLPGWPATTRSNGLRTGCTGCGVPLRPTISRCGRLGCNWLRIPRSGNGLPSKGVVSHRSAAAVYGLGHLPADVHEFILPVRRQSRRSDVRLHRAELDRGEWTSLAGLPVTRPARIAADLIHDREDPGAVAQVIADALRPVHDYPGTVARAITPYARRFGLPDGDGLVLLEWLLELTGAPERDAWLKEARDDHRRSRS
jgi:hypothetical protein